MTNEEIEKRADEYVREKVEPIEDHDHVMNARCDFIAGYRAALADLRKGEPDGWVVTNVKDPSAVPVWLSVDCHPCTIIYPSPEVATLDVRDQDGNEGLSVEALRGKGYKLHKVRVVKLEDK